MARGLPADTAWAATSNIGPEEWERARSAHARSSALADEKPRAKRRRDEAFAEIERRQVTLRRLRQARFLTQTALADELGMDQSEVSRLERRSDLHLSTLRRFVRATGGELVVLVSYPDGEQLEVDLGDSGS